MVRELLLKGSRGDACVKSRTMDCSLVPKKMVASSSYWPTGHPSRTPKISSACIGMHTPPRHSQSPLPLHALPEFSPPWQTHPDALTHLALAPVQVRLSSGPPHQSPQFSLSLQLQEPLLRHCGGQDRDGYNLNHAHEPALGSVGGDGVPCQIPQPAEDSSSYPDQREEDDLPPVDWSINSTDLDGAVGADELPLHVLYRLHCAEGEEAGQGDVPAVLSRLDEGERERSDECGCKDAPDELRGPVRRCFLQHEEHASHWSSKGCGHPRSCSRADELQGAQSQWWEREEDARGGGRSLSGG
eukprot:763130-Hanusia_phi.AAC.1